MPRRAYYEKERGRGGEGESSLQFPLVWVNAQKARDAIHVRDEIAVFAFGLSVLDANAAD